MIGALFVLTMGLTYLTWRKRQAAAAGEGYGTEHVNEPAAWVAEKRWAESSIFPA